MVEQMQALRGELAARDAAAQAHMATLLEEFAARDVAAQARNAALRADLSALREGKSPFGGRLLSPSAQSFADVGSEALAELASRQIMWAAAPPSSSSSRDGHRDSEPVASPDDLVAAISPLLRAARGLDEEQGATDPYARVLVNSEPCVVA